jgi:hypothetical protein
MKLWLSTKDDLELAWPGSELSIRLILHTPLKAMPPTAAMSVLQKCSMPCRRLGGVKTRVIKPNTQ